MRDIQKYAEMCMRLLDDIGIKYGEIREFTVNTRAKSRWGQCKKMPEGYFKINVNVLLLDERNDENGLINTIIHELLHTCEGCTNHGSEWQLMAAKVYNAYGLNIKRTSSAEEKGIKYGYEEGEVKGRKIKHKFVCKGCGRIVLRIKNSKFVQHPDWYTCGRCGDGFVKIF